MIEIKIGPEIIRSYKRLAYTPWHALAEFVDNSTQSYFNNRSALKEQLKNDGHKLEVSIAYDRNNGILRITDNAMGMSFEELVNAVQIGRVPEIATGRSQYGLGMKTAACWLGNEWTVTTKRLGEDTEHSVTVNVDRVAAGDRDLRYRTVPKPTDKHYTIVEIRELHQRLQGKRLGKIKQFLASMYRVDIREGLLDLEWTGTKLVYEPETDFLTSKATGKQYHKTFDFDVNGRRVHGWVAILREGGRSRAGFSILRKNRVVRGHPDAWRPESIFGQFLGTNDLINQRIVGEIYLDDFEVSHTKDDILWNDDELDLVEKQLKKEADDFVKIAREHRVKDADSRGPTDAEVQAGVDRLREEMQSKEFVDLIEVEDVPPPDLVDQVNRPVVESVANEPPTWEAKVGDTLCKVYLAEYLSPNDPYFVGDIDGKDIIVVVNRRHPHWKELKGSEGVYNFLCHCVYDAIAEWQCARKDGSIRSETVKLLKDRLLRLPFELEQAAVEPGA